MTKDMFRWPVLGFMLKNRLFLVLLRLVVAGLFIYAIIWGFMHPYAGRGEPSLTTGLFWGLFWPFFMMVSLATFGALFCGVCPHGFMGRFLTRIGLKRAVPQGLKTPLIGLAVLVVGYWLVIYTFPGLYKTPWVAATLFGVLTLYAAVLFLIYEKMAYCKVFCPIGLLTRVFGRVGFAWLTTDANACAKCDKAHACAKACPYGLNPERFDAINSMEDCKLCMKCAHACDSVRFEARAPASSLFKPMRRAKSYEAWGIFAILWILTLTMQLHHGLGHSAIGSTLPWSVQGASLGALAGEGADWVGVMAVIHALFLAGFVGIGGIWAAGRMMDHSFTESFKALSWGYAPLVIFGSLSHVGSFFFFHYYSDIVNGLIVAFYLPYDFVAPLADRRTDGWLNGAFKVFTFVGIALSAAVMWRRVSLMGPRGLDRVMVFVLAWALGAFYLWLQIFRLTLPSGH
jgi:polyferredoxin